MKERFLALFHNKREFVYLPLTLVCVFVCAMLVIWALLARNYGVERFKQEFEKAIAGLNDIGYDVAYDSISFSSISPFKIAAIKNFKLYKQDNEHFWAWNVEELGINASILNYGSLVFYFNGAQTVQIGEESFSAHDEGLSLKAQFDADGLYNLLMRAKKFEAEGAFSLKEFRWAVQRLDEDKKYNSKIDLRHVALLGSHSWHMSDVIEEFFADIDVYGTFEAAKSYRDSLTAWDESLGNIEVNRLILNWKPLVLVGKGDISFTENLVPEMKLVTTSRGLVESLDNLEKAEVFDGKSVLVAKILLSSKMTKLRSEEDPEAIISTISVLPNQINIENIPMFDLGVDKK